MPQQLAETLVTQASQLGGIDIQTAAFADMFLYIGENMVIFILEKVLKPLIAADEARGEAR